MKLFVAIGILWLVGTAPVTGGELSPACQQAFELWQQSREAIRSADRIDYLRRSLALCARVVTACELGDVLLASDRPQAAIIAFDQAFDIADTSAALARALTGLGMAYQAVGQNLAAVQALRAAYRYQAEPHVKHLLLEIETDLAKQGLDAADIERGLTAAKSFYPESVAPSVDLHIHFDFDRASLAADGRRQADQLGHALISPALIGKRFVLEGHTDSRGSDVYNLRLSEMRAQTVKQYLVRRFNIDTQRLQAIGFGETAPLYVGGSEREHALNRRVVIRVVD